jgi:hypothetical protein
MAPALPNHLDQPPARVLVVPVCFQMFRQLSDACGQQRNLDFW